MLGWARGPQVYGLSVVDVVVAAPFVGGCRVVAALVAVVVIVDAVAAVVVAVAALFSYLAVDGIR